MIEGMVCTREHDDYDKRKVTTFVKIGGGCNGHEATMHGGMISTVTYTRAQSRQRNDADVYIAGR